jgi:ABC-type branched-subunit amino acid transport system substrate-binding protein
MGPRSAVLAPAFVWRRRARLFPWVLLCPAFGALFCGGWCACSAPNLSGQLFACQTNADCAPGFMCGAVGGTNGCVPLTPSLEAGVDGGTDGAAAAAIEIGMTAAFSGVSGDLGTQVRRGILAWFNEKNANGGVHGRTLTLTSKDDQYEPEPALLNTYSLLGISTPNPADYLPDGGASDWHAALGGGPDQMGPNGVLAMIGCVGTPQMLRTAPVCVRDHVIFFAPFTGALTIIRDGTVDSPYVFNYRASYNDETAAMVAYLTQQAAPRVTSPMHVLGFTQGDSYGAAGYQGFYTAWNSYVSPIGATDIPQVSYTRNEPQTVGAAVTAATQNYLQPIADGSTEGSDGGNEGGADPREAVTVGIFMIDTYDPASSFIKGIVDWQNEAGHWERKTLNIIFMNVSFVGGDALLQDLVGLGTYVDSMSGATRYYGDGVWVTQVVPYYNSRASGVVQYQADLKTVDSLAPTWGSLEGYLDARLLTEGFDRTTAFNSDAMVKAYESIQGLDLGIGVPLSFSSTFPGGHQASKTVWLSKIQLDTSAPNGLFTVPLLYGPTPNGTQIQPNGG